MKPVKFKEQNKVYNKPEDMTEEECSPLPVYQGFTQDNVPVIVSCWELSQEELKQVKKGGKIWLTICAHVQPPVSLATQTPFTNEQEDKK